MLHQNNTHNKKKIKVVKIIDEITLSVNDLSKTDKINKSELRYNWMIFGVLLSDIEHIFSVFSKELSQINAGIDLLTSEYNDKINHSDILLMNENLKLIRKKIIEYEN